MSFQTLRMPPAAVRWELAGPAGVHVDELVSMAIGSGCTAEMIEAGRRYRLDGDAELLAALAEQVAKVEGFTLAREAPPDGVVRVTCTVEPARNYRRVSYAHGPAFSLVTRAVDHGLKVGTVGILRWSITGASAVQVAWLAAVQNLTTEEVLLQWRVTPEQIAAEDASLSVTIPLTVPVRVELPARRRTTQGIERDGNGEIVRVESIETDDEK